VNTPLKAMFLMQIAIIADLGIAPRNARRSSASMVSLLGDLACGPETGFWEIATTLKPKRLKLALMKWA
jgi:hypothetical protein